MIEDNTYIPPETIVSSFSIFSGNPGKQTGEVAECMEHMMLDFTKSFYQCFKLDPDVPPVFTITPPKTKGGDKRVSVLDRRGMCLFCFLLYCAFGILLFEISTRNEFSTNMCILNCVHLQFLFSKVSAELITHLLALNIYIGINGNFWGGFTCCLG